MTQPFASQIRVVGQEDPYVSGNFEVFIHETGQLIHSKTRRGQGKAETDAAKHAIALQIEDALEAMEQQHK